MPTSPRQPLAQLPRVAVRDSPGVLHPGLSSPGAESSRLRRSWPGRPHAGSEVPEGLWEPRCAHVPGAEDQGDGHVSSCPGGGDPKGRQEWRPQL